MPFYLVSYDIAEKDVFEYEPLWKKLKEIGATRILYSDAGKNDPKCTNCGPKK